MGCFFAQNLTVFEKPKPKDQCERDAAKPSVFAARPSVFAARLRAGLHEGSVVYDPLQTLVINFDIYKGYKHKPINTAQTT